MDQVDISLINKIKNNSSLGDIIIYLSDVGHIIIVCCELSYIFKICFNAIICNI